MRIRKEPGSSPRRRRQDTLSSCRKALSGGRAKIKRLAADRQALAAIVDSSRDALWSWTPDGIIVRWNAEAERLFGYKSSEVIGQSLLTLVPPNRRQRAREIIKKAAQGQWYGQYETTRVRKDGTSIDVELTVSPITNKSGTVIGCLSSCRDISERKQFQASLAERMNELTTLTRLTARLQSAVTVEDTYNAALDAICHALRCDRASVLLFDSAKIMRFVAWRGLSERYRKSVDGHSPWTVEAQNPEPICINDVDLADQPDTLKSVIRAEGIRSLAFIPLVTKEQLIGKFMTYYQEQHTFSASEMTLANSIAQQLAIAIDRQCAQEHLREFEARFRLMSENAPVMIWMSDAQGNCQHLNAMLRAFWGVQESEISTFDWQRTMHPDDAADIGKRILGAISNRRSVAIKGRYLNADGQYRVLHTDARPRFSSTSEFLGMIGVNVDITEQEATRRRISADLDAMTRLQQLGGLCAREGHNFAKCLSAVVDVAAAITGAPRGSLQLVELGSGEMTIAAQHGFDTRFLRFFTRVREDAPVTAAAAVRTKERVVVEDVTRSHIFYDQPSVKVLLKAGVRAVQSTPLIGSDGRVFGVLSTHFAEPHKPDDRELRFIDLLARQTADYLNRAQAEEALRKLQGSLEAEVELRTRERDRIWNVSEDLLGVSNFEGYFLSINPAWEKTLGWTEEEIKALHVDQLRHPDDAAQSRAGRQELARGVQTVRMENRFRHKDGSWRWIAWTLTTDNGLIYVAGRHVTSEKEAAASLERAYRQLANAQKMEALGQLTGGVAHDFNNIMMIVSGYAQTLQGRLKDPKNARELKAIQAAVARGENLTRQLLSFSRHQPLNPIVIHPADAIEGMRDVLSGSTTADIDLSVNIAEDTWPICVDKSEFALALVNIAINARDAMPNGGRLSITSGNQQLKSVSGPEGLLGDFVALKVTDTGCGIPANILSKVFDPFFTTKEVEKGTGLGLSQVYGFAHRSGGTVVIDSELQRGTTVTVYLPRSHGPVSRSMEGASLKPDGQREGTILVVEDNDEVRGVATSLLRELGYSTLEASTGAAALQQLNGGVSVDLVFSDVVLPGAMDGLSLAQEINFRYPQLPVLLTTGYARRLNAKQEFPILRKPYDILALDQSIRETINTKTRIFDQNILRRKRTNVEPAVGT